MLPENPNNFIQTAETENEAVARFKMLHTKNEKNVGHILQSYFQNQRDTTSDSIHKTNTDVLLICNDGIIPAHAVILQAVSPFFEKIFKAQGLLIIGHREILLPDFSCAVMSSVVRLIYDEHVYLMNDLEAKEIQEAISCLQIYPTHKLNLIRETKPSGESRRCITCHIKSSRTFISGPTIRFGAFGKVTTDLDVSTDLTPTRCIIEPIGKDPEHSPTTSNTGTGACGVQEKSRVGNSNNNDQILIDSILLSSTATPKVPTPVVPKSALRRRTTRGVQNETGAKDSTKSTTIFDNILEYKDDESFCVPSDKDDSDYSPTKRENRSGGGKKRKKTEKSPPAAVTPPGSGSGSGSGTGTGTGTDEIKGNARFVDVTKKQVSPCRETATPSTAPETPACVRAFKENFIIKRNLTNMTSVGPPSQSQPQPQHSSQLLQVAKQDKKDLTSSPNGSCFNVPDITPAKKKRKVTARYLNLVPVLS